MTVVERVLLRGAVLDDRVRDLAEGRADRANALEVAGRDTWSGGGLPPQASRAFLVDQAAIREPGDGPLEGRQLLPRETIVVVEGVQEVEGRLDVDVVRVAFVASMDSGFRWHRVTTLDHLTGYAQEGNLQ